ncbi:hypothetical protein [Chitinophaga filiformis]|uniref:Quinol oxidase subunit 4 n=1 Tax=Chitinophaga filiformis TaxID=104663 RepID=A0ABY4IAC9_CHIFI|nr:hypothetical protein [Chitinophaga filiformis]UPK72194.1 hypothetical protein MYF79_12950 [Chitinophaga filiformis]
MFVRPILILSLLFSFFICCTISACTYRVAPPPGNPHGLPPGQAKKLTGSKSARPYAPGQQKKRY